MDTEAYQEGDMKKALKNAFMTIDEAITTEEVSIPILNYFFMQNTYGNTASCVRVALMLQEYAHKRKSPVKCITLDLQYEFAENWKMEWIYNIFLSSSLRYFIHFVVVFNIFFADNNS